MSFGITAAVENISTGKGMGSPRDPQPDARSKCVLGVVSFAYHYKIRITRQAGDCKKSQEVDLLKQLVP